MTEPGQYARLREVAQREAERHTARPGAFGALLYGSLAPGRSEDLTPFSDVDLALVLDADPMPEHFTEHRMTDGIKVDVLLFSRKQILGLVEDPPVTLWQRGWTMSLLLTGLMRGGIPTVLSDPTGELTAVVAGLNQRTTYRDLFLPDARSWVNHFVEKSLPTAHQHRDEGRFREAVGEAGTALWYIGNTLKSLAETKNLDTAAERLGLPELPLLIGELGALADPEPTAVTGYHVALQNLWGRAQTVFFTPVTTRLQSFGVADPATLELVGDYPLFWPGNRVTEWGRLIHELHTSLRWAGWELEQGHPSGALNMLWAVSPDATRKRFGGVRDALASCGYDVADLAETAQADAELQKCFAAAEMAAQTLWPERTSSEAEWAITIAIRLQELASGALIEEYESSG